MCKKGVWWGLIILVLAGAGAAYAASGKMLSYDYTFAPDSEPNGFRGIKWQTDITKLDPFRTMECIEIMGEFAYYRKNQEDLKLGPAELEEIIYEFWNGRFSSVFVKARGNQNFQILREYCFARFGPGQRSKVYERMDVQDYYWNGYFTRMYLKYSDIDRTGDLSLHSIAMLNKQQKYDTYVIKARIKEKLQELEKPKGK